MSQPNILLVMTDQQRWDALGCVTEWMETPNMDRIAAEGAVSYTHLTLPTICSV